MNEAPHPSPASTSATSSELALIEQLKRQLAGPLFAAVSDQFSNLQNTVISYQNKLQCAELPLGLWYWLAYPPVLFKCSATG